MKKSLLVLSVCLFGAFCCSPEAFAKHSHHGKQKWREVQYDRQGQESGHHHKMKHGLKNGFKDGWKGPKKKHGDFKDRPEGAPDFDRKPFGDFKDRPEGAPDFDRKPFGDFKDRPDEDASSKKIDWREWKEKHSNRKGKKRDWKSRFEKHSEESSLNDEKEDIQVRTEK